MTYHAKEMKGFPAKATKMQTIENTNSMLTDWTDEKTAQFQNEIVSFRHALETTGLFTDDALAVLLDKHPSDELDVCTMGSATDTLYPNKFRTGDFRNVDGKTLVAAAKSGAVWINVRRAMNIHPEYKAVLDDIYGDLAARTGNTAFNPKGGILISSPVAKVPFHVDKTETILWHVRGSKRIFLYPMTQDFIPDVSYEATLTNLIDDDLPYRADMDASAKVFNLEEGQALSWPLNSPHRVENDTFCVSVTTEYSTRESATKNSAMLTNAVLRSKFGMNPAFERDGALARRTKSVVGRALRKSGLAPNTTSPDLVTFKLDPGADGFIVDTPPFTRDF